MGKRRCRRRAYCGQFGFKGGDQQKAGKSSSSGGERNRVHLAEMLRAAPSCSYWTNRPAILDVDTLRALEEALQNFAGCAW